jgi:hypothetical protein
MKGWPCAVAEASKALLSPFASSAMREGAIGHAIPDARPQATASVACRHLLGHRAHGLKVRS